MFVAGLSTWSLSRTTIIKSTLTLLGFGISVLLRVLYRSLGRRGVPLVGLVVAALPLSFAAAAVWMAIYHFVLTSVSARDHGAWALALRTFPDVTNTIYYFFVLVAWSVLYFGIQASLDLGQERSRLARAELLAQQARLRALRLQLNPHFLFNTLNAISALVSDLKGAQANAMICRLADFLRATLEEPASEQVSLAGEIELARRYLEIEAMRFGPRLRVDISVSPEAEPAMVPPMILQPLVENAVRHAVLPREGGGQIAIVADRKEGWLTLSVHDDGPGLADFDVMEKGVGLSNTFSRLAELYGSRAQIRLARSERGGLAVLIRLPFRPAPIGAA
jgi:LytS/YehU family sensor histidine kinase